MLVGYSSPSSSPWLDVGAPPSIDGTPAGGAGFGAGVEAFRPPPPPPARFGADRPELFFAAGFGAAFLAGFLEAFFLAALRFAGLRAVLPAAFLVVLVFFFAPFLAAIPSSCGEVLHHLYGHLRYLSNSIFLTFPEVSSRTPTEVLVRASRLMREAEDKCGFC